MSASTTHRGSKHGTRRPPSDSRAAYTRVRAVICCALGTGLLLVASCTGLQGATFRAGVAKVDITPPPGLPMYGFFDRIKDNKLATGTLDPLYARALVIEVGLR